MNIFKRSTTSQQNQEGKEINQQLTTEVKSLQKEIALLKESSQYIWNFWEDKNAKLFQENNLLNARVVSLEATANSWQKLMDNWNTWEDRNAKLSQENNLLNARMVSFEASANSWQKKMDDWNSWEDKMAEL